MIEPDGVGPYVTDILAQPDGLRALVRSRPGTAAASGLALRQPHERIVLTGMGASLFALCPAWMALVRAGRTAWLVETAQLLHDVPELLSPRTLLIVASQSGLSAEIVSLSERRTSVGTLLAITNDPSSPLSERSDVVVDIRAGVEHAVSTRTYVNTLAAATLVAEALTGATPTADFEDAADSIERYLESWRERVDRIKDVIALPDRLYILGRGESVAAASCGALILKEAAKWPAEAMSASQFRHGPLELADERLTAVVLAGHESAERERNLRLVGDIERFGGRAYWADEKPHAGFRHLPLASGDGGGRNIAEIVALQLLSVAIAEQTPDEPGVFRHLGKVTTTE